MAKEWCSIKPNKAQERGARRTIDVWNTIPSLSRNKSAITIDSSKLLHRTAHDAAMVDETMLQYAHG